ncbi:hypothetical protein lerEdw1_006903 [Lerista edwardsae]|nr:hypothetical protein lerEdw1_006903 [Lerista edwardsae]
MLPISVGTVIALIVLRTFCSALEQALDGAWKEWKDVHDKRYLEEEAVFRREVWEKNLQRIEQHNLEASLGKHSFKLAMNHLGDLTDEEFNQMLNGFHPEPSKSQSKNVDFLQELAALKAPKEVDWRTKGYVTPVKNQGHCGSCWAFSATGALEALVFNKTGKLVSLSEQNLIDCSWKLGNHGCHGGLITRAFEYVRNNGGINSELAYPYVEKDDASCHFNPRDRAANCTSLVMIEEGREAALEWAVATVGPVSVAVDARSFLFHFYKSGKKPYRRGEKPIIVSNVIVLLASSSKTLFCSGIFASSWCSQLVNHAMLAVGYGTFQASGKNTDYWILKNSVRGRGKYHHSRIRREARRNGPFVLEKLGENERLRKQRGDYTCTFIYAAQGGTNEQWQMSVGVSEDNQLFSCSIWRPQGKSYLFFTQFKAEVKGAKIEYGMAYSTGATGGQSDVPLKEEEFHVTETAVSHKEGKFRSQLAKLLIVAKTAHDEL